MKFIIYIAAALVMIIGVVLIAFSIASRKQPELGLLNGQLPACPATSNCVCSEYLDDGGYVEPLGYTTTAAQAWTRIQQVIIDTGGTVITEEPGYLHIVYETPLLRFIDDVEFRLDDDKQQIHVRSASRVGQSDLGANRKRVDKIRAVFNK